MEKLPPINEMYSSIREQSDFTVQRRYEGIKKADTPQKTITKRGNFLENKLKGQCSPGPANIENSLKDWSKAAYRVVHKHSDRVTYIDEIDREAKKHNPPSPNSYVTYQPWLQKQKASKHEPSKITLFERIEFDAEKIPGVGAYYVTPNMVSRTNPAPSLSHIQTKSRIEKPLCLADMNKYDPVPMSYKTFKSYQTIQKQTKRIQPTESKKKETWKIPGPGQYNLTHDWNCKGDKQSNKKGTLDVLTRKSTPNIYYG